MLLSLPGDVCIAEAKRAWQCPSGCFHPSSHPVLSTVATGLHALLMTPPSKAPGNLTQGVLYAGEAPW